LDRILTLIVNRISNTSYHLQYLYYPGGNETGAKPNLITCITEIFLSAPIQYLNNRYHGRNPRSTPGQYLNNRYHGQNLRSTPGQAGHIAQYFFKDSTRVRTKEKNRE
jgi:hypothetical protein